MRIGIGYDIHRLVEGRPLMLGGVRIPHTKGLQGHSDGDSLIHAIVDALLSPTGMGDIGSHFAPNLPKWQDAPSMNFLRRVTEMLGERSWSIVNVDATIVADQPMVGGFIQAMRGQLATGMGITVAQVTVQATTNEGLGPLGTGDAMAAWAVALLEEPT